MMDVLCVDPNLYSNKDTKKELIFLFLFFIFDKNSHSEITQMIDSRGTRSGN